MELLVIGDAASIRSGIDLTRASGNAVVGFCSDDHDQPFDGVPHLGRLVDLPTVHAKMRTDGLLLTFTDIGQRMNAAQRIAATIPEAVFRSIIHPTAVIGQGVVVGSGSMIMAGAVLEVGTVVGDHVRIGTHASIGADTHIGTFVNIGAGAVLDEACHVGTGSAIGIQAGLVKRIVIGTHCVVGHGSMVLESVPDLHVAQGTPARCVRTRLVGEPHV